MPLPTLSAGSAPNSLDRVAPRLSLPIVPFRPKLTTYKVPPASTAGPSMPEVYSDRVSLRLGSADGEPRGAATAARIANIIARAAFAAICRAPLQPAAQISLRLYFLICWRANGNDCSVLKFVNIFIGVAVGAVTLTQYADDARELISWPNLGGSGKSFLTLAFEIASETGGHGHPLSKCEVHEQSYGSS